MSDIAPISRTNITGPNPNGRITAPAPPGSTVSRGDDTVELSSASQTAKNLLAKLREGTDLRHDLISRIRREEAAGTYVTDDKINAAIDNLMDDLD